MVFGALGDRVSRELDHFCGETDFIDRSAVARLVEQKQGPQLWYLLNLALWWKHFIAGESLETDDWTNQRSFRADPQQLAAHP